MPPKGSKTTQLDTAGRKAAFTSLLLLNLNGVHEEKLFVKARHGLKVSKDRLRRLWKATLENAARHLNHQNSTSSDGEDNDLTHIELDWRDVLVLLQDGSLSMSEMPMGVFASGRYGCCGRPRVYDREELKERTRLIPRNQRSTYRAHARELGIS